MDIANTVHDWALTTVAFLGLRHAGTVGSLSRANAARSLYGSAKSASEIRHLASIAATSQLRANYITQAIKGTALVGGITMEITSSGALSDRVANIGASLIEEGSGTSFPISVAVRLSQASERYINSSGIGNEAAAATILDIHNSILGTKAAIDNRLNQAISACDEKFK